MTLIYDGKRFTQQISFMNQAFSRKNAETEEVKKALHLFINDTIIQGEGFERAKGYYRAIWVPILNGIQAGNNCMVKGNDDFLSQFVTYTRESTTSYINVDKLQYTYNLWQKKFDELQERDDLLTKIGSFTMLKNMQHIQELINSVYNFNSISSYLYADAKQAYAQVEKGITMIHAGTLNESNYDCESIEIRVWKNQLYDTINRGKLTKEELNHVREIGYSDEEIYALLDGASEEDLVQIRDVINGNYHAVFTTNLQERPIVILFIADYIERVNNYCITNNDFTKLQEIFAGFSYSNIRPKNYTHDAVSATYVYQNGQDKLKIQKNNYELIMAAHGFKMQTLYSGIVSGVINPKDVEVYYKQLTGLDSLYNGIYYKLFAEERRVQGAKVTNITYGENGYSFTLSKRETGVVIDGKYHWSTMGSYTVEALLTQSNKDALEYQDTMRRIDEKRYNYIGRLIFDETLEPALKFFLTKIPGATQLYSSMKTSNVRQSKWEEFDAQESKATKEYLFSFFDFSNNVYQLGGNVETGGSLYSYENAILMQAWSSKDGLFSIMEANENQKPEVYDAIRQNLNGNYRSDFYKEQLAWYISQKESNRNNEATKEDFKNVYDTARQLVEGSYAFDALINGNLTQKEIVNFQDAIHVIEGAGGNFDMKTELIDYITHKSYEERDE